MLVTFIKTVSWKIYVSNDKKSYFFKSLSMTLQDAQSITSC